MSRLLDKLLAAQKKLIAYEGMSYQELEMWLDQIGGLTTKYATVWHQVDILVQEIAGRLDQLSPEDPTLEKEKKNARHN